MKKINLEKLKVGDMVWTIQYGWTTVKKITTEDDYPIIVDNDNEYTSDGKWSTHHAYPSMFLDEPFIEREMEVSSNGIDWVKRTVFAKSQYGYVSDAANVYKEIVGAFVWKYAREIESQPEPCQPKEIVVDGVTYIRKGE